MKILKDVLTLAVLGLAAYIGYVTITKKDNITVEQYNHALDVLKGNFTGGSSGGGGGNGGGGAF